MKFCLLGVAVAGLAFTSIATNAFADVGGLQIRFGGGCHADNVDGSCIIKVLASGTDLSSETVQLYTAAKHGEALHRVSSRVHPLSTRGDASFRVKNIPGGCYQVRTGPNGNDKRDARSRTLCE